MNVITYFGSDVFTPYTALYSWKSNQVAHGMMGFAATTLVSYAVVLYGLSPWWGLMFMLIPLFKDITDYLVDSDAVGGEYELQPEHKRELRWDGITDFFFWSAGAALAALCYYAALKDNWTVYLAAAIIVPFIIAGSLCFYYLKHKKPKMAFDNSNIPHYRRLPQFGTIRLPDEIQEYDGNIIGTNSGARIIRNFVGRNGQRHLLLVGPRSSVKTSLACCIGCELTARGESVRYRTWEQLRDDLLAGKTELTQAEMDICDDMLPPFEDTAMDDFEWTVLNGRRVLWVIARDDQNLEDWKHWIKRQFSISDLPDIELNPLPAKTKPLKFRFWTHLTGALTWIILVVLFSWALYMVFV